MKKYLLLLSFLALFIPDTAQAQRPYITVWKTDNPGQSNNNQITIITTGDYTYTWEEAGNAANNGSGNNTVFSGFQTITFPTPGIYQVALTPTGSNPFNRITTHITKDNLLKDKDKLLKITQWGAVAWSSFEGAYDGCTNLSITATDTPDLTQVSSMAQAFRETGIDTVPNMNHWDMSHVTDMEDMFYGAGKFNQAIGHWDVSHVENIYNMFALAFSFNQPIGDWNVSSVTNMMSLFYRSEAFNQPLDKWDVSHVENMENIFTSASSFNQSLEDWTLNSLRLPLPYSDNSFSFVASGMSCEHYSRTLRGWAGNHNIAPGNILDATSLRFSPDVTDDRNLLINTLDWTIKGDEKGNCVLSIPDIKQQDTITVAPNPTTLGYVIVSGLLGRETVRLTDITGRVLQTATARSASLNIHLSHLPAGMYNLIITTDAGQTLTRRIVNQR